MTASERPGLTRTAASLLIGAPLLMAVARLLLVPFADSGAGDWERVLTQAAAHQDRSDAGWVISLAACGLLAVGAVHLAAVLRAGGGRKAASFVVVSTALGWAAAAGMSAVGLLFSYQGLAPDRAAQVKVLVAVNDGHSAFVFLMCVVAVVGYVVLAIGLLRRHVVSKGAGILVGLGGAGTLFTTPGSARPLLIGFALVLLVGQLLVVRDVGIESSTREPAPAWEPVTA
jgi:hypothetical protein